MRIAVRYREKELATNIMTRRGAIRAAGAGLAYFALSAISNTTGMAKQLTGHKKGPVSSSSRKSPNIIFILSDDHRWDAMSCMGHPVVRTPHMDRLAREGVLFENAFVTTSLCSPSRASFLTGQYAHTHGVKNNLLPWDNRNVTFLEKIKGAGYRTGFIGKWHMPGEMPRLRGLDRFVTFTESGGQGIYFNCPMIVDGKKVPSREKYITDELTDYAVEFVRDNRDRPFCLYLSHKAVHLPFSPPEDMKDLYRGRDLHLPPESDSWVTLTNGNFYPGTLQGYYSKYLACVSALDRSIGTLLESLESLDLLDNTVIVYAGDNGHFFGEHHLFDKRWPYEESIRVPFIVRYPGAVQDPGRREGKMLLNIDLAPTLLDIAGVDIPDNIEGMSFLPLLRNGNNGWRSAWLYEYFRDYSYDIPDTHAVRTERYKYIEYASSKKPELFDLVKDPGERKNIINTRSGKKELPGLKNMLKRLKGGEKL